VTLKYVIITFVLLLAILIGARFLPPTELEVQLKALSARLRGRVPDLEELYDMMHEIRIDRGTANAIVALAKWFEIARYTADDV
jgi:hypothetical protein